MSRLAPVLVLMLFLGPIAAGVAFSLLPAFGIAIGLEEGLSAQAIWTQFFAWPGLLSSTRATLISGLGATVISLGLALAFTASVSHRAWYARVTASFLPFLSIPHAGFAIAFAFLIAPSGWIARLLSPAVTGWDIPPQFSSVQDPLGFALMAGLVMKETPFLIIALFTAHSQVPAQRLSQLSASLGYGSARAWLLSTLPQVYPHIRLPLFAVLAYGLSTVDMAIVLGPTNPPTLSLQALRWFNDPELTTRGLGAAAALVQTLIILAAIALWFLFERLITLVFRPSFAAGRRWRWNRITQLVGWSNAVTLALVFVLSLAVLTIWSLTRRWRYPDALPSVWTTNNWTSRVDSLWEPALNSLIIAIFAVGIGLVLSLFALEARYRLRKPAIGVTWILYLPLLIPQVAFLFGVKLLSARFNIDGTFAAVIWVHLLFVLPYILLMLSDPFERFDFRYRQIVASLGKGPWWALLRVHLPMIRGPLLFAAALGFAVSISQYLATILIGAGRTPTLTTEALALASGGDRRLVAALAFLQMVLPLIAFGLALLFGARRGSSR